MVKKWIVYIACLLLLPQTLWSTTIYVKDQKDFNNIATQIIHSIEKGESVIKIIILPGTYEFNEQHIILKDVDAPKISLKISGKGMVSVVPSGNTFMNGDSYDGLFDINNSWMCDNQDVFIWSETKYVDGLVEVVNKKEKICRFKSKESYLPNIDVNNAYVMIPEWFTSRTYKIINIDNSFIYFYAPDLEMSYNNGYNVNDDYNYKNRSLRYRLCNVKYNNNNILISNRKITLPQTCPSVHEGKVHNFITINNCSFRAFELQNLSFRGNRDSDNSALICFLNSTFKKAEIRSCEFVGIRSNAIHISASSNISVANNHFKDCYKYGIISNKASTYTKIQNNTFHMMGKWNLNVFSVLCSGSSFLIKNNLFRDFGFGGIAVGKWYRSNQIEPCYGIVEDNELSYSDSYIKSIKEDGLMDGGAIYTYTINDGTIIRNNYIHDISGVTDNRGIFCDDGSFGLQVYGNIITGICNSYCVDARRVSSIENYSQGSKVKNTNVNLEIYNNIIDGEVRFEANEIENNGCKYGGSYVLVPQDKEKEIFKISGIYDPKEDIIINCLGTYNGTYKITPNSYKNLKRSPIWKEIKKHINK